jgi:hypothetical protein
MDNGELLITEAAFDPCGAVGFCAFADEDADAAAAGAVFLVSHALRSFSRCAST